MLNFQIEFLQCLLFLQLSKLANNSSIPQIKSYITQTKLLSISFTNDDNLRN